MTEPRAFVVINGFFASIALAVGCLLVGIGIYAVTHADRYATSTASTLTYVAGPIAIGISILAAVWLAPPHRGSIGLVVVGLGAGLVATEIGIILLDRFQQVQTGSVESEIDILKKRRLSDPNVYPTLTPRRIAIDRDGRWFRSAISLGGQEVLPLGGISRTTHMFCYGENGWQDYSADERGFKNPVGAWRANQIDAALIGDSLVQGFCVPEASSIAGRLREKLGGVLNLGLLGSGPLSELAVLKEWGPLVRPKVVGWFFWEGNDFGDLVREKSTPALLNYLEPGYRQDLAAKQEDIDAALKTFVETNLAREKANSFQDISSSDRFRKIATLYHLRSALGIDVQTPMKPDYGLFRTILSQAKDAVAGWGGVIIFVGMPVGQGDRFGHSDEYRLALEAARSLNIPVVDIAPALEQAGGTKVVFDKISAGHYGATGYRIVADMFLAAIKELRPDAVR